MLIATLINTEGKTSLAEVPDYPHRVPPYLLMRDDRVFIIDYTGWEPTPHGQPCEATFKELGQHRMVNISHLKLQAPKPADVLAPAEEAGDEAA